MRPLYIFHFNEKMGFTPHHNVAKNASESNLILARFRLTETLKG